MKLRLLSMSRTGELGWPTILTASISDQAAVREWVRTSELKVSERGRISAEVMRQYEAAR